MKLGDLKAQLKALGTAQNRKVYQRHGYGADTYGVSFANLAKLKKEIKVDHPLALKLWETGNADERSLATMIADPALATEAELDAWVQTLDVYVVSDLFASYVGKTRFAKKKAARWSKAKRDWVSRAGWDLFAGLALRDEELTDDFFRELLVRIERQIHGSSNYTRHAMNNALIAIGIRNKSLQKEAVSAARRIGEVVVDHGQTGCKTPNAEDYIKKTLAYRAKKDAKKKSAKKVSKQSSTKAAKKVSKKSPTKAAKEVSKKSSTKAVKKVSKKKSA